MVRYDTLPLIFVMGAVFLLAHPQTASAIFYNDSVVIEIGDGLPTSTTTDGSVPTGGGDMAADDSSDTSGAGSTSSGGSSSPGDTGNTSNTSNSGGTANGGSSSADDPSGSSASSGSAGSGSSAPPTENDVVDLLVGEGALEGVLTGSSGGVGGVTGSGSISAGVSGTGGGFAGAPGSSLNVKVDGNKVRAALADKFDLKDVLQFWRKKSDPSSTSAQEYGLIAASTALRDANVQHVSFTASAFQITYRSRGYLFAIIPMTFPVQVDVVPSAAESERVRIRLPWYRFFVRTFFTTSGLSADIAAVIAKTEEGRAGANADANAAVFDAVAAFLKARVGTVGDSVILGASS